MFKCRARLNLIFLISTDGFISLTFNNLEGGERLTHVRVTEEANEGNNVNI